MRKRNEWVYYLYTTTGNLIIIGPIMVLYMLSKGLNYTQILLLQSISAAAVVLLEIPTGALADRFSRKSCLVIGPLLWGITLLIYTFCNSFYLFALGEVIFALGATMKSGSDTALMYDSLGESDRKLAYQKIEGHAKSYMFYAQAAGSIVAGFLYSRNIHLPLLVSVVFMICASLCGTFFRDPGKKGEHKDGYLALIGKSIRHVARTPQLRALFFFIIVFFAFFRGGFFLYQPYFKAVELPVMYFGVAFFLFNIVAANASRFSAKIVSMTKHNTLMFLAGLILVSFFLMWRIRSIPGILAILMQQAARGLYHPVTKKYLNKYIESDRRATTLSVVNMGAGLSAALFLPLVGYWLDHYTVFQVSLISGLAMGVLLALSLFYLRRHMGRKVTRG